MSFSIVERNSGKIICFSMKTQGLSGAYEVKVQYTERSVRTGGNVRAPGLISSGCLVFTF